MSSYSWKILSIFRVSFQNLNKTTFGICKCNTANTAILIHRMSWQKWNWINTISNMWSKRDATPSRPWFLNVNLHRLILFFLICLCLFQEPHIPSKLSPATAVLLAVFLRLSELRCAKGWIVSGISFSFPNQSTGVLRLRFYFWSRSAWQNSDSELCKFVSNSIHIADQLNTNLLRFR